MIIKDGSLLYELSKDRFYKWLKSRLNGCLDEIEDIGGKLIGQVGIDITDISQKDAREMTDNYFKRG